MKRSMYCNSGENVNFIGHGGSIAGFGAEATWYPDAQVAVVVLFNSSGNMDPGAVAGELAAEVLPWTRPTMAQFTGDPAPLVGKYQGPSRGRDMVVEVTQTPQGLAFSANGTSGPVTELRFDAGSGYYILKRQ